MTGNEQKINFNDYQFYSDQIPQQLEQPLQLQTPFLSPSTICFDGLLENMSVTDLNT
jgi:hypothetical protein